MPAITLIIAPSGISGRVLDVLTDLSALDLLEDFAWVTEQGKDGSETLWVASGRQLRTPLNDIVDRFDSVNVESVSVVRTAVLVPLIGEERRVDLQDYYRLTGLMADVPMDSYTIAFANPDQIKPTQDWAWPSWHNFLLSPEDSSSPRGNRGRWSLEDGPVALARRVGPAVASLLGLWRGTPGPFDGETPQPTGFRLVRCFHANLDASAIEARLRAGVFDTDGGPVDDDVKDRYGFLRVPRRAYLPLPQVDNELAQQVPDASKAAETMATRLWDKHPEIHVKPEEAVPKTPRARRNWKKVLRDFFKFLGKAIKGAPKEWWNAKKNELSGGVAKKLQDLLYGSDSAYKVVVAGVGPDGMLADWDETKEALSDIEVRLLKVTKGIDTFESPVQLGTFWQDFVGGALTLADAGRRGEAVGHSNTWASAEDEPAVDSQNEGMPPIRAGQFTYVVRQSENIVPGSTWQFTTPGALEAMHQIPAIDPADCSRRMS